MNAMIKGNRVHPTATESGIDELDEVVAVVPNEIDGSIMYATSALTMNGKVLCCIIDALLLLSSSSSSCLRA